MDETFSDNLIKLIDKAVTGFQNSLPGLQEQIADNIEQSMQGLERDKLGALKPNAANFKKLANIKTQLQNVLTGTDYGKISANYLAAYTSFVNMANVYFESVSESFTPTEALRAVQSAAIDSTVENLSKTGLMNGIGATLKAPVLKSITNSIASGTPYLQAIKQMRQTVTGGVNEGPVERYAKPIATDSLNRFSANYLNIGSLGLGMDWFMYVGPIIKTTRCWCRATLEIKYIHRSEFQALIDMSLPEFDCEVMETTGLAQGMIDGTTPDNLVENRGGYNCLHQLIPVPDSYVPDSAKGRIV